MKTRIFAIVLCVALLCPLCACSDKPDLMKLDGAERADAFFDIVNEDPADAYVTGMQMEIVGSLYGVRIDAEIESKTTYVDYKGSSPVFHAENSSEITVGSDAVKTVQTVKTVSGYRDGKLYEKSEKDGKTSALVSALSADEFKAHQKFLTGYTDEELEALHKSATVKECVKEEDGTWSASFSGYSEENVLALIDYAFDSTVLMLDGYKVKDVIFKVEADADFLPTDWEYEIVFERSDDSALYPEAQAKTEVEFKEIGTAKAPEIDLSSYTEVEGLAELQKLRSALGEYLTSDEAGSFKAESKQNVNSGTSMSSTHETDTVTYEVKNGEYTFEIDANVKSLVDPAGTDYTITYKNGNFAMLQKGTSNAQRQEMTESNARIFIYRLIDPAGLSDALVSNIKTDDGKYTHTFTIADPDYSALEASLAPLGATDFKADATVSVVYKDDVLEEYCYQMTMTCKAGGLTVTVKVESTVTFN